jgi:hypothetical protein
MLIAELGLAPATKRALRAAGIKNTEQLQRPANELLATEPITGAVLYDVVRGLQTHKLGLLANSRLSLPTGNDIEMLRLRVVEALALRDIALTCGISPECVRQRLNRCFGLNGEPPAALERRRFRWRRRPEWERIIALRLCRFEGGLPMAILLRGFSEGPLGSEARAVIGRMEAKGLLTVHTDRVQPTEALRLTFKGRPSPNRDRQGYRLGMQGRISLPARAKPVAESCHSMKDSQC